MTDETKTVTVAPGAQVYTGAGLSPFREGDRVPLPAEDADAVVDSGGAEHAADPEPDPDAESDQDPDKADPDADGDGPDKAKQDGAAEAE